LDVTFDGGAIERELPRNHISDLRFRLFQAEEFEDPGANEIKPEHLALANV
jgi:hypothetical protein